MRMMGLLVTIVMAWATSLGIMASSPAPDAATPAGELAQCLVPMGAVAPPLVSCPDHSPSWSDLERQPDPQWIALRAR